MSHYHVMNGPTCSPVQAMQPGMVPYLYSGQVYAPVGNAALSIASLYRPIIPYADVGSSGNPIPSRGLQSRTEIISTTLTNGKRVNLSIETYYYQQKTGTLGG